MEQQYTYSIWKRKTARAVVRLYPQWHGKCTIIHNGKEQTYKEFFGGRYYLMEQILTPFTVISDTLQHKYDIVATVSGGGIAGQAYSLRLAISKALIEINPEWRTILKPYGLLVRDARIKERKKPGLKKARKAPTWSKR